MAAKLAETGLSQAETRQTLDTLRLDVKPFDVDQAIQAGLLRQNTKRLGLSLGDRACLGLALMLGKTAITADQAWEKAGLPVKIRVLR